MYPCAILVVQEPFKIMNKLRYQLSIISCGRYAEFPGLLLITGSNVMRLLLEFTISKYLTKGFQML
jgi:hypothetical protein